MHMIIFWVFVHREFKFGKSGEHDMTSAESSETGKNTDWLIDSAYPLTNLAVSVLCI